jgi:hypothetical protein
VKSKKAGRPASRRRQYFIDQLFQTAFIVRMNAVAIAIVASAYGCNYLFFWNFAEKAGDRGIAPDSLFLGICSTSKQCSTKYSW